MSLNPSQLLAPRESMENFNSAYEDTVKNLDAATLFKDVIGHEIQKRVFMDSILSHDPVHNIIIGPPGNGKSLFLKCIEKAFPQQSKWIDSTTSSGIGMIERIIDKGKRLRFLLVDEIEKFDKDDRNVFLGLLEGGNITRDLKDPAMSTELKGLRIWLFATCNDIKMMHRYEKPLLSRCDIVKIPALDYDTYMFIAGKRLQKEKGVHSEDIAKYIAWRVYTDLGKEMDMRECIRQARKSHARAVETREDDTITKDIVDVVIADYLQVKYKA